jgi:hypothetical protein
VAAKLSTLPSSELLEGLGSGKLPALFEEFRQLVVLDVELAGD